MHGSYAAESAKLNSALEPAIVKLALDFFEVKPVPKVPAEALPELNLASWETLKQIQQVTEVSGSVKSNPHYVWVANKPRRHQRGRK